MTDCDACGDPITDDNGLNGQPLKAERDGEVFTFCRNCDGYKTLRVPTADWVLAQRQRDESGRTWGEQIVRPEGKTETPESGLDFPTAGVKEAVREVLREELRL